MSCGMAFVFGPTQTYAMPPFSSILCVKIFMYVCSANIISLL
jgi:hypothetical protein